MRREEKLKEILTLLAHSSAVANSGISDLDIDTLIRCLAIIDEAQKVVFSSDE